MSKEVNIQQNDHWRILLTEILPYETPFKFSYESIYNIQKNKKISEETRSLLMGKNDCEKNAFIPFTYTVQKGAGGTRELGIIHPHLLEDFVDLYSKFDDLILSQCSKSRWSLRHPAHIAKTYTPKFVFPENTESENPNHELPNGPEQEAVYQKNASSYFAYSPHNFLYKFFESKDLLEIERNFRYCKKLDIAKCFANIYTHSISWAMKTKLEGKKEIGSKLTFDSIFDTIIRKANDNETHGILIGPEISRIFAEIILQQIDTEVRINCEKVLKDGKSYTIRRYVDDYFLFYNDDVTLAIVQKSLEDQLKKFKLYLNTSKESVLERPFLTDLSVCKNGLRRNIIQYFKTAKDAESNHRHIGLFSELRSMIRYHNIEYSSCSAYILSQLYSPLLDILKERRLEDLDKTQEFHLCEIVQISFSLFAIDPRFRTSFLLGKIIVFISRKFSESCKSHRSGVSDLIAFEIRRLLEGFVGCSKDKKLEISTLLMTLIGIPDIHPLPLDLLEQVCLPDEICPDINYFLIVTLFDVFKRSPQYLPLQTRLKKIALAKLIKTPNLIKDCESFMLAIDLMASPFLTDAERAVVADKIVENLHKKRPTVEQVNTIINDLKGGSFFFDWGDEVDLAHQLAKKELAFSY